MTQNNDMKLVHSPDKLLVGFAKTGFLRFLLISVAVHIVIILLLSLSYIRDQIDPEGAERRKAEALALQQVSAAQTQAVAAAQTQDVAAAAAPSEGEKKPAEAQQLPQDSRTNSLIVKQITELPKPEEVPAAPDDLGISISDTNPD